MKNCEQNVYNTGKLRTFYAYFKRLSQILRRPTQKISRILLYLMLNML